MAASRSKQMCVGRLPFAIPLLFRIFQAGIFYFAHFVFFVHQIKCNANNCRGERVRGERTCVGEWFILMADTSFVAPLWMAYNEQASLIKLVTMCWFYRLIKEEVDKTNRSSCCDKFYQINFFLSVILTVLST